MNNDEARFLLCAYRPGGRDASDPALAEALAQAERDPALRTWFAREQAFDTVVAEKLQAIAPPADLRTAILAGARAGQAERAWWQRPQWLALAASVALLLTLGGRMWLSNEGKMTPARFGEFAINDMLHGQHGGKGEPTDRLIAILANPATRVSTVGAAVDFEQLKAAGCRTLELGAKPVLEVCFQREGAEYHLYIAKVRDFPARGAATMPPEFLAETSGGAVAWSDGRFEYALAGSGIEALRRVL